jgi:hypothetical protein
MLVLLSAVPWDNKAAHGLALVDFLTLRCLGGWFRSRASSEEEEAKKDPEGI